MHFCKAILLLAFFAYSSAVGAADKPRLPEVDALLVLAVDVSGSVTRERWELQRRGYAEAFRDPEVIRAITSNINGKIAVTLVQWSGPGEHVQAIGWTIISSEEGSRAFAARVGDLSRIFEGNTHMSAALNFCVDLIDSMREKYASTRAVIDISGDGLDDQSPPIPTVTSPISRVRQRALKRDIVINGLPLLYDYREINSELHNEQLVMFYKEHVIVGPGSFMHVVKNAGDFGELAAAIKRKIILEIS